MYHRPSVVSKMNTDISLSIIQCTQDNSYPISYVSNCTTKSSSTEDFTQCYSIREQKAMLFYSSCDPPVYNECAMNTPGMIVGSTPAPTDNCIIDTMPSCSSNSTATPENNQYTNLMTVRLTSSPTKIFTQSTIEDKIVNKINSIIDIEIKNSSGDRQVS